MSGSDRSEPVALSTGDERQPLLAPLKPPENNLDAEIRHDEESDIGRDAVQEQKRSLWDVGFYVVLAIVCFVLLGVLVKGFADADDVDVSITDLFYHHGGS